MLTPLVYIIVLLFTAVPALALFLQKKLLRSVIALAFSFAGSALIFVFLGQTMIALLQLLVFVGGVSTYLIVAVASDSNEKKLIHILHFGAIAFVLSAALSFIVFKFPSPSAPAQAPSFVSAATSAFVSSYTLLYVIVLLLFAATFGSIVILKRFTRLLT